MMLWQIFRVVIFLWDIVLRPDFSWFGLWGVGIGPLIAQTTCITQRTPSRL